MEVSFWNSLNLEFLCLTERHNMLPKIWILVKKMDNLVIFILFSSSQYVVLKCVFPDYFYHVGFVHGSNSYLRRREL